MLVEGTYNWKPSALGLIKAAQEQVWRQHWGNRLPIPQNDHISCLGPNSQHLKLGPVKFLAEIDQEDKGHSLAIVSVPKWTWFYTIKCPLVTWHNYWTSPLLSGKLTRNGHVQELFWHEVQLVPWRQNRQVEARKSQEANEASERSSERMRRDD